jgi:uncharacterized Zn finger protein
MDELDFLSPQVLKDYADGGSFERGRAYFNSDSVFNLEEYQGKVVAKVSGTRDYRVKFWAEDEDELGYDCNCPYADEGNFCKHLVAVGLAWIAHRRGEINEKNSGGGGKKKTTTLDEVKAYLQTREKTELVEMLMQQVLENETLRGQLMLSVARNNPKGVDIKTYKEELKRVFDTDGYDYDDYYDSFNDSEDVENVVESIEGLFNDGHYQMVIDLCEYGLKLGAKILNFGYESDGTIEDAMENLQELHLSACKKAKPDVEILANRLFELELNDSNWSVFHNAADKYADVLGKKGLQIYRQLIEKEWAKVPFLKPNDKRSYDGNRYKITNMMESLVRAEGNIEKLVEIKTRDLSSQYRYYEIAEIYREKKKYDTALEWAERGISDFPSNEKLDWRLGEFIANEYHRRSRHDEAMQIIWKYFAERPDLGNYHKIREHADKIKPAGTWQNWREKALEYIRQDIETRKKNKTFGWSYQRADNSLLVQIFLEENLPEQAWQEAQQGGCTEDLWLKFAKIREKDHPADSLKIYQDRIEPKVNETNNQAYEQAVKWLKEVNKLMKQLGREAEFEDYLTAQRVNYKIKRNFIKLLDSTKW